MNVLHNHIMINAYALDGKHFLSNKTSLKKIKAISDEVCKRYGIEPYRKTGHERKTKISGYHEWKNIKSKTSWKQQIREKIDELVPIADSFDDLVRMMNNQGFTFRQSKNICVKAPGQQRSVSLKTLGENYTFEQIVKLRTMNVEPHEAEQLIRTLAVIRVDGIHKVEDARRLAAKMKSSEQSVKKERGVLHREIEKLNEAINRADVYVRYKDDPSFRDPDFLEMCRKIAEENDATDSAGFERLVAKRDELKARDDCLSQSEYFYRKRTADYESVIEAVQFINIYPQERSAEEKKTPHKKKLRR